MKSEIVKDKGYMSLKADGKIMSPVAFRSFRPKDYVIRDFEKHNIHLFNIFPSEIMSFLDKNRSKPYSDFGPVWLGENEYCWDNLKKQVDLYKENAPDGYVSVMIHLDTREWFLKQNPECVDSFLYLVQDVGWKKWREATAKYMCDLMDKMEELMPGRVYGYFLLAGGTTEWYTARSDEVIENPAQIFQDAFKKWSGDENKKIPSPCALKHTSDGIFRSPGEDKESIDYWRFYNEIVTDTISYFAKKAKEHCSGNKVVGVFSGYLLGMQLYYLQRANYNDTMTILNDENINVLFAPASYKFRKLEYTSAFRVTIDSLTLHNKLYFHELDSKSHLAVKELPETHRGVDEPYKSIDEVTAYYRREISMVLAKGQGFWFFDMLGGWFNDPELMQEFERLKALSEEVRKHERKSLSEVAMFVDLESNYYLGSHINYEVAEMQLNSLNKMGLPWDSYVTEDLLHLEFDESNYKLMIFVNLFKPSEAIKEKLTELRKKGVSFLFFHAPGYISENGFSIEGMKELCSITLKKTDVKNTAVKCADSNEVYDFPPPPDSYYQNEYVCPSFCADDKDCEVWGEYEENGEPAFVVKYRDDGSFDAFSNSYPMPGSQLKKLALRAGAFEYLESCEPVYMSSAIMGIYSYTGGIKKVKWKEPVKIREYFTNEVYNLSPGGTEIAFKPKETKVFLIEKQ